jgi:hypothetical protein
MYSFIYCTCYQILLELWKKRRKVNGWLCRVCVTWDMHTGLPEIFNHNEQSTPHLGAYMYTKLESQWHILCRYWWLHSLSDTLQHSRCSKTITMSTVVMLGFWLCHFNTGIVGWRLCLLSSGKFFCLVAPI